MSRKILKTIYNTLKHNNFEKSIIHETYKTESIIRTSITLPITKTDKDVDSIFANMCQELKAHDYRIVKSLGKHYTIDFSLIELADTAYNPDFCLPNTLQVALPSNFGIYKLDLLDGASTHLLIAGASRMGKTRALIYIINQLTLQTNNNLTMHISSPKPKDFYPFKNVHNISNNIADAKNALLTAIAEYKRRDKLINSPELEKATDAKDIYRLYPQYMQAFEPVFIVIDEFSRFSQDKEFQSYVTELSETAGYMNIHLIIATQRPDAKRVIHPNIKANFLCRIAFTTANEGNSEVILDTTGAELLGGIQGRALLLDGMLTKVQFPNLDQETSNKLMQPFKGEKTNEQKPKRLESDSIDKNIQSMFKKSNSIPPI